MTEPDRQQRAQHAAAVHGKRRNHVEDRKKQVHGRKPVDHGNARALHCGKSLGVEVGVCEQNERNRNHDIDRRPGERNQQLLARLFRDAFQPRDPADRKQRHIRRRHSERARREDVPELVRQDAGKQQDHEGEAGPGRLRPARIPARDEDPAEKQHERDVDADRRTGDPADIHRPAHGALLKASCREGMVGSWRLPDGRRRPQACGAASSAARTASARFCWR